MLSTGLSRHLPRTRQEAGYIQLYPGAEGIYRGLIIPGAGQNPDDVHCIAAANETSVRDMEIHKQKFDAMLLASDYTDL